MTAQMHRRRVDKGSDPIGAHCKRGSPHSLGGRLPDSSISRTLSIGMQQAHI